MGKVELHGCSADVPFDENNLPVAINTTREAYCPVFKENIVVSRTVDGGFVCTKLECTKNSGHNELAKLLSSQS